MSSEDDQDIRSTSPEDAIVEYQNLQVKFQINESQTVAQVYPNCLTIEEVKKDIGKKFEVDPEYLIVTHFKNDVPDSLKLFEITRNEFGIVELFLKIADNALTGHDGKKPELNLQVYYNKSRLADFITVRIPSSDNDDGVDKDIVVEIQNQSICKPFLGGYKDTKTGIEYLDAYTQTGPPTERMKFDGVASRDCQTSELRTKSIDTFKDHSTQSFGNATKLIYVADAGDQIIVPKKYESCVDRIRKERKIAKVRLIQRNFRRYLWQRLIKNAASEYRRLREEQKNRDAKRIEATIDHYTKECVVKTFPRTKEDFDLLYAQVQRWKEAEIKRINMMYSGASRIAELGCLLDKEVQLLNGIEQQRNLVRKALRDFRDEQHLKKLGQPIRWVGYRNYVIEMDLLRTQRVRYLTGLLNRLKEKSKKMERLELLSKITEILLKEENSASINEIIDLFEREKSLLVCSQMCAADLDILRKRQLVLFVEIIKDETSFKPKKPTTRMCTKCKIVKPMSEFALRTRQNEVDVCKACFYLKGTASTENSIYKAILRTIQRKERKKGTLASFAFIMQEDDIRFIIENIWHGHSILSQNNGLSDLRLPRWIKSDDWSPWNCVCLTESEARAHATVTNLEHTYDDNLILLVQNKHMLARAAFKKLKEVEQDYVESGDWYKAGIREKVV